MIDRYKYVRATDTSQECVRISDKHKHEEQNT